MFEIVDMEPSGTVIKVIGVGGAGNNRWDNIQINADAVPAPGSIALVGLAGLVAGRRRRN